MSLTWLLTMALLVTSTRSWADEVGSQDKTGAEVRVSSCLIPARIIRSVRPKYPPAAKEAKIEGPVVLQVIVGKNGRVKEIQWRFRPYRILGEAVETDAQVTVNFELTPRKKTSPGAPKPVPKTSHLC